MKNRLVFRSFKIASFVGFLSIPHILHKIGIKPTIFSTWDDILAEFWGNLSHHLSSLYATFSIGIIAITISLILGITLGLIFSFFNRFIGFFESTMKFFWSIPLIVFAVYLNLFINVSEIYIVITGVFLGFFPLLNYTYYKCLEQNEGILSIVASFNLSKTQEYRHFRIKEVFKGLIQPLSQSIPLTYIGVTMGEYTVGKVAGSEFFGLGSDFYYAMNRSQWTAPLI